MINNYTNAVLIVNPMPGRYPTKEEILAEPRPFFRRGLFNVVTAWKVEHYVGWKDKGDTAKLNALGALAAAITDLYQAPHVDVLFGAETCYDPEAETVWLETPSIISLLHELAHHLFGQSEYHACRFSVWLYQLRFRTAYDTMLWQDHLLRQPSPSGGVPSPFV